MILGHPGSPHAARTPFPGLDEALSFLAGLDPRRLSAGRIEIAGERMFAIVVDGEGKGPAGARLETHRDYIDIQYQVAGTDRIGWSPADGAPGAAYDQARDLEFHDRAPTAWIDVPPGCFAVFFPEDAHAPMGGTGRLLKVVVKVRA